MKSIGAVICQKEPYAGGKKKSNLKKAVSNHKHGNLINQAQNEDSLRNSFINMDLPLARQPQCQGQHNNLPSEKVEKNMLIDNEKV